MSWPDPLPEAKRSPMYSLMDALGENPDVQCPNCLRDYKAFAITPCDREDINHPWACGLCHVETDRTYHEAPKPTLADVRAERARRLATTDWTQLPDVPDALSERWRAYRQALRDVTDNLNDPENVSWPQQPS